MAEDKEPTVMKVLNLAKQNHGIGEGDTQMNINCNNCNISCNIQIKTSPEEVSHIGNHMQTWTSKMTPTACSSPYNLEMNLNLQFQFQLETGVKPELIHHQLKKKRMN